MARQIHDDIRGRERKKRRDHRRAVNLWFDFLDAMAEVGAQLRRVGERPQAVGFERRAIGRDAREHNPKPTGLSFANEGDLPITWLRPKQTDLVPGKG